MTLFRHDPVNSRVHGLYSCSRIPWRLRLQLQISREDKGGTKVLTRKGRWGIALFLFSILINISSDALKDIRDRKAAQGEIANRQKTAEIEAGIVNGLTDELKKTEMINTQLGAARADLSKTATSSASTLAQTRRLADPFAPSDDFSFWVRMDIPTNQPLVKSYTYRVFKRLGPNGKFPDSFGGYEDFPDPHNPSEADLATLVASGEIYFQFRRKAAARDEDRYLEAQGEFVKRDELYYKHNSSKPTQDYLWVQHTTRPIRWRDYSGGFRSYLDFEGASVLVYLTREDYTGTKVNLNDGIHREKYSLRGFGIKSPKDRAVYTNDLEESCGGKQPPVGGNNIARCFIGETLIN